MSATSLIVQALPACPDKGHFVSLPFNIVILLSLYFILRSIRGSFFSYTIDGVSAGYLLFGTSQRSAIISNTSHQLCSNQENFYLFFVSSLASWIGAIVLESRTCIHMAKKVRDVYTGPCRELNLLRTLPLVVLTVNSVFVMALFSWDVSKTVSENTTDSWLFTYHLTASIVKVLSTACQGLFLVLHQVRLPNRDTVDGYFLLRMVFINTVTLLHSFYLLSFGGRSGLLILDFCFRLGLCFWYGYSYYLIGLQTTSTQCTEVEPERCELEHGVMPLSTERDRVMLAEDEPNSYTSEFVCTLPPSHPVSDNPLARDELVVGVHG